jgi:hypothetical protein
MITKYHEELPVTDYDADPDYREALLRRIIRFLIGWATEPGTGAQS